MIYRHFWNNSHFLNRRFCVFNFWVDSCFACCQNKSSFSLMYLFCMDWCLENLTKHTTFSLSVRTNYDNDFTNVNLCTNFNSFEIRSFCTINCKQKTFSKSYFVKDIWNNVCFLFFKTYFGLCYELLSHEFHQKFLLTCLKLFFTFPYSSIRLKLFLRPWKYFSKRSPKKHF